MTDTEVTSCHKLTKLHIECTGSQRQNVALATQLLSHHTATASLHYLPGPSKESAELLETFVEKINKWFDAMNSFTTSSSVKTKLPYGFDIENQNTVLDETYAMVKNMQKKSLQIFQKGILISISSLKTSTEI